MKLHVINNNKLYSVCIIHRHVIDVCVYPQNGLAAIKELTVSVGQRSRQHKKKQVGEAEMCLLLTRVVIRSNSNHRRSASLGDPPTSGMFTRSGLVVQCSIVLGKKIN